MTEGYTAQDNQEEQLRIMQERIDLWFSTIKTSGADENVVQAMSQAVQSIEVHRNNGFSAGRILTQLIRIINNYDKSILECDDEMKKAELYGTRQPTLSEDQEAILNLFRELREDMRRFETEQQNVVESV